jgi:hypothetical protein
VIKDIIRGLKDWRNWLLAFVLFIFCEFTYGCSGLQLTEKGVRYDKHIVNGWYFRARATTDLREYKVRGVFYKTINMEDLIKW